MSASGKRKREEVVIFYERRKGGIGISVESVGRNETKKRYTFDIRCDGTSFYVSDEAHLFLFPKVLEKHELEEGEFVVTCYSSCLKPKSHPFRFLQFLLSLEEKEQRYPFHRMICQDENTFFFEDAGETIGKSIAPISSDVLASLFLQLSDALIWLCGHGYMYPDLHAGNVCLNKDKNFKYSLYTDSDVVVTVPFLILFIDVDDIKKNRNSVMICHDEIRRNIFVLMDQFKFQNKFYKEVFGISYDRASAFDLQALLNRSLSFLKK